MLYYLLQTNLLKFFTCNLLTSQIAAGDSHQQKQASADKLLSMAEPIYPPRSIPAYRADAKRPGKLETQSSSANYPHNWPLGKIYEIATAQPAAVAAGAPAISAEDLVNMMLTEGRADAGTNEYNRNNPQAEALYKTLSKSGYGGLGSAFSAALLDKTAVAKRLNIPLGEAWNGTGRSSANRTGKDHAARLEASKFAATEPKNAQLLDYVKRALTGNLTTQEHLTVRLPMAEVERQMPGNDLYRAYEALAWSYNYKDAQEKAVMNTLSSLSTMPKGNTSMPNPVVNRAALNSYRKAMDMPPIAPQKNATATESTVADILAELPVFNRMISRLKD